MQKSNVLSFKNRNISIDQFLSIINGINICERSVKRLTHENILLPLKNKIRKSKLIFILYKIISLKDRATKRYFLCKWKSNSRIYINNIFNATNIDDNISKHKKLLICIKIIEFSISKKQKYNFLFKLKNIEYNNKIRVKNEEISELKNNNTKLDFIIKELEKNDVVKNGKIIGELNEKIKMLENLNNKDYIIQLMDKIIKKDEEIEELKSKIPFDLSKGEKLMSVIFISSKKDLMYSIICKNTDIFNKLVNILYKKYPMHMNSDNFFICNAKKVNEYQTLENNGIEDHAIIVLNRI